MNDEIDTNETIADIVREMRYRAISKIGGRTITERKFVSQETVDDWADRIEAAAKRDKDATEADSLYVGAFVEATRHKSGNSAAMREALMKAKLYFDHRGEGTNLDDAGMAIDAITSIDAALAAPPRNCDRYPTLAEAVLASGECTAEAPSLLGMGNAQLVRFARWLYAPAEGGEHA